MVVTNNGHAMASLYKPHSELEHQPDTTTAACFPTDMVMYKRNVHLR
jgi:hypothetical protein